MNQQNTANIWHTWKGLSITLCAIFLGACSSHIPLPIRQNLPEAPDLQSTQQQTEAYKAHKVRWGGMITRIENRQSHSQLEIIALPLDSEGRPQQSDQSPGRFIALVDQFLEPEVYSPERMLTIVGTLQTTETRKIGEFPYVYPVIQVEHYYLWPIRQQPAYRDDWRYDPWMHPYYYPGYPYYPWYSPRYMKSDKE